MIYKNAEIHNAAELKINNSDGSMEWHRVPKAVIESLDSQQGKDMAVSSTGVEIRFVMKRDTAVIRMQSISKPEVNSCFHVYRGGIQGEWFDHEINTFVPCEPTDFIIKRSENLPTLKRMAALRKDEFSPEVIRIVFDRGSFRILDISGDIQPPKKEQTPKKTLLCYGSSITHGSNAIDASHSWASVLAHNLNSDLRNLGMAGSCAMEPEIIDYIASEGECGAWDAVIMELGINVLNWEESKIYQRVENAIKQVAGRNKDKKVYVVSPFYCGEDFDEKPEPNRWRTIIKEVANRLAFDNVTLINGLDILGDASLLSADAVHPNIYGVQQIAERMTALVKSI